jgi:hypothetical protein
VLLCVPVQLMADRGLPVITVCFNYACNRTAQVRPSSEQWQAVVNQFKPPAQSAAEERQMIRRAIAILEHIAGTWTPTYRDRGRNPIVDDWPGQMDCIDESTSTKRYLDLLQEWQLLQWHRSVERAYRTPHLVDPHWAGQIIELESQDRYIVDPGFSITVTRLIYRPGAHGKEKIRSSRMAGIRQRAGAPPRREFHLSIQTHRAGWVSTVSSGKLAGP